MVVRDLESHSNVQCIPFRCPNVPLQVFRMSSDNGTSFSCSDVPILFQCPDLSHMYFSRTLCPDVF